MGIFIRREKKFLISASEAFAQISAKSLIEKQLSLHLSGSTLDDQEIRLKKLVPMGKTVTKLTISDQ
jgi:hypothetical protein